MSDKVMGALELYRNNFCPAHTGDDCGCMAQRAIAALKAERERARKIEEAAAEMRKWLNIIQHGAEPGNACRICQSVAAFDAARKETK